MTFPFLPSPPLFFPLYILASHRIVLRCYRSAAARCSSEPSSEQTFRRHFLSFCRADRERERERESEWHNATLSLLHFFASFFLPPLPAPLPWPWGVREYGCTGGREGTKYHIRYCHLQLNPQSSSNLESPGRERGAASIRFHNPQSTHSNVAFRSEGTHGTHAFFMHAATVDIAISAAFAHCGFSDRRITCKRKGEEREGEEKRENGWQKTKGRRRRRRRPRRCTTHCPVLCSDDGSHAHA